MWDNFVEDGAPVTACGIAGAGTGALDGWLGGVGPELVFHLAALGAVAGVGLGVALAAVAERLGRHRLGRRLLRDGPLVALGVPPLLFLGYAWRRGLALDALEPRLFLLPALFAVGARTLHGTFGLAEVAHGRLVRRLVLASWAGLGTAFVLTTHGLVRAPVLVVEAVQSSELGGALLRAARRSPVLDRDGDGYPRALCVAECDCEDADPAVHPAAREIPDDGLDQDCSGADLAPSLRLPASPPAPPPATPAATGLGAQPSRLAAAAAVLAGAAAPAAAAVAAAPPGAPDPAGPAHDPDVPAPDALPERPDLLLVTVDTLRADHLGCYGYPRATSPFLDAMAAQGTLFEQARAQGSMTAWSMPSLVTGRYFTELERTDSKWPIVRAPGPHLGERLASAGYHTAGVAPQFYFRRRYGLARGFADWDTTIVRERTPFHRHVTGDRVTERAIAALSRMPANRPALLWVHYGDPHSDYLFHEGASVFGTDRKGLYDGEIRFTDDQLRTLVAAWRAVRPGRPKLALLTADHGENLDRDEDHGALYHGTDLFDSLIRVPLVVFGDGVAARRVATPVALLDVLPTLVEVAGLPADASLPGRSLVPWLEGRRGAARPVFAERPRPADRALKTMVDWPYKLIWHQGLNRYSLFDLAADPGETADVFGTEPAHDAALVERMVRWRTLDLAAVPASAQAPGMWADDRAATGP